MIGRLVGEGQGCESQGLINAQRTVLTVERGGRRIRELQPRKWQQDLATAWMRGGGTDPRLRLRDERGRTFAEGKKGRTGGWNQEIL